MEIYNKLQAQHLSADMEKTLQAEVQRLYSDQALAAVYGKYADRIVAGSEFNTEEERPTDPDILISVTILPLRKLRQLPCGPTMRFY